MAKLAAAAFLLLFAFSHASSQSDLPTKEVDGRDPADRKLPGSSLPQHFATGLRLPSQRQGSESEPVTVAEKEPLTADSKIPETDEPTILANEESTEFQSSETVPLTFVSFRPINRHFPRRPIPMPFRHRHRCRHHGHPQFGPWTTRSTGGERVRQGDAVSYGDDMILSSGEELGFDPAFRGGVRQIPPRWVDIGHGGPRFPFKLDDEMEFERPHHHHHHRHHHGQDHREEFEGMEKPREHKHDHDHEHGGGFMRKFRKFLNHF